MMLVAMDNREKNDKLLKEISKVGIKCNRQRLKIGDYLFGDVIIESKSVDDFCSSIMDNRLTSQITRIEKKHDKCFLLVYGKIEDRTSDINENCVVGKIVSILIKHNIKIIWVDNEKQAAYAMKRIFERYS